MITQEFYAVRSRGKNDAKHYSSEKRAKNATKSLCSKFVNVADAKVVPLE